MPEPEKILIVTGDAAESLEVLYPYQRLLEEGYEVHIAAPERKTLRFVVHDFEPGYDTHPALEPDMQSAGATFQDTEAVVDGPLISSRAWPDHPAWMREFLKVLRSSSPSGA
ncbi:DJ-1/PfpI family protein [Streptomyces cyaneofuscatus]|uniref:DJ-1/PfpI family protein n=1 Tax=Streptomyces cyaneofuscatus TaxID=66883 RepID=UPI0036BA00C2